MNLAFSCGCCRGRETEDPGLTAAAALLRPDVLEDGAVLSSTLLPLIVANVGFLAEDVEG